MRFLCIIAVVTLMPLAGCTKPMQKSARVVSGPSMSVDRLPLHTSSSLPAQPQATLTPEDLPAPFTAWLPSRSAIVQSATRLIGARTITSQGRRIAYDCAGVAHAIFLEHGIDLYRSDRHDVNANGVRLIYNHVRRYGTLHHGPEVRPGDLVFFDSTWDFNGDGKANDPLTHVGIVEGVEPDGTVIFISRVASAIERYRMNLEQPHIHKAPDGRVLNDYIRRKRPTDPTNTARLTGELFSVYGNPLSSREETSLDERVVQIQDRQHTSSPPTSAILER
ncbi:MAG: CHAP domain-containing protein [Nitrospira sp.]|nr:CHAP domain-containing protein [Nitrospira sp.]MDH4369241.1 CHAP domain-containing protein [Nitrospira sp.]MDH5496691.1 CHAP domain-containing protein [Nitrospira sp.]MDH5724247.1 CHAP domain-containing protein [Nitrospira sp.]